MSKFVIVFVFLAIAYSCDALQCYHCSGCPEAMDQWKPSTCTGQNVACVKHVYEDANKNKITDRKCIIKSADSACNAQRGTQISCDVCEGDLCNSSTMVYGQYAFVFSMVALLLQKILF